MSDVDYQQPAFQIPGQGVGDSIAAVVQRAKQQAMEKSRLGMEQEQQGWQRQQFQAQAKAAADRSSAQSELYGLLQNGTPYDQVAKTRPDLILRSGQTIPKPVAPVQVRPGSSLVNPQSGQSIFTAPPAPQRPMSVPAGGTVINPQTGQPMYTAPAKPQATFSPDTMTMPDGTTLNGQRNSLTKEFKPFSTAGQEGGSPLARAAAAAKTRAAEDLKRQASRDKTALQKILDNPLALKTLADKLTQANPKLIGHAALEAAGKQIQDQIDAKDKVLGEVSDTSSSSTGDKSAQGGYKVGATYEGNLIYQGGDPNDQSSWTHATQ